MMSRPAPKHAPRVPFALLLAGLLVGGLAILLALNTASAANELRRHDLAARDATVSAHLEHLRNELAVSRAPANLARVAAQLGMVPAGNPAFVEIGTDGRARVLGSPAPASAPPVQPASTPHRHHHGVTRSPKTRSTKTNSAKTNSAKTKSPMTKSPKTRSAESRSGRTDSAKTHSAAKTSAPTDSASRSATGSAGTPPTPPASPSPNPTTTLPGGAR